MSLLVVGSVAPGEWWLFQMRVKDNTCLVRINGDTVMEYDKLDNLEEGPIELQAHDAGKWTEYKQVLYDICVVGTQGLVSAVAQAGERPPVFVSASTAGYYPPDQAAGPASEAAPPGSDFLGRLAADWEAAAAPARDAGVRICHPRMGLVLGRGGGGRGAHAGQMDVRVLGSMCVIDRTPSNNTRAYYD